jgi:hypothetical protein
LICKKQELIMFVRILIMTAVASLLSPMTWAETIAKVYPVKDFAEFVSGGNTSVEISQDGTEYLRVEADAEVMKRVKVDQTGKRVSVWVKSDGDFFKWFGNSNDPVRIILRVKQLEYLEASGGAHAKVGDLQSEKFQLNASGAGNADFAALNAEQLKMDLSGAGNVRIDRVNSRTQVFGLSGASNLDIKSASTTGELNVEASGASNFRGKKLTAKTAELRASGASHVEAAVTDVVYAEASGASTVDYYGNPKAKTNASGASQVKGHTD